MSTTAGVFTETTIRNLRVMADEIMFDDRIKQQFIPQVGIVDGLRIGHACNACETAPGGSIGSRFDRFRVFSSRFSQMDVHINKAGKHGEFARIDFLPTLFADLGGDFRNPAILDADVHRFIQFLRRINDSSLTQYQLHKRST